MLNVARRGWIIGVGLSIAGLAMADDAPVSPPLGMTGAFLDAIADVYVPAPPSPAPTSVSKPIIHPSTSKSSGQAIAKAHSTKQKKTAKKSAAESKVHFLPLQQLQISQQQIQKILAQLRQQNSGIQELTGLGQGLPYGLGVEQLTKTILASQQVQKELAALGRQNSSLQKYLEQMNQELVSLHQDWLKQSVAAAPTPSPQVKSENLPVNAVAPTLSASLMPLAATNEVILLDKQNKDLQQRLDKVDQQLALLVEKTNEKPAVVMVPPIQTVSPFVTAKPLITSPIATAIVGVPPLLAAPTPILVQPVASPVVTSAIPPLLAVRSVSVVGVPPLLAAPKPVPVVGVPPLLAAPHVAPVIVVPVLHSSISAQTLLMPHAGAVTVRHISQPIAKAKPPVLEIKRDWTDDPDLIMKIAALLIIFGMISLTFALWPRRR